MDGEILKTVEDSLTRIYETLKLEVSDSQLAKTGDTSFATLDKIKEITESNIIKRELNYIAKILSDRFGFNIELYIAKTGLSRPAFIVLPKLDYININVLKENIKGITTNMTSLKAIESDNAKNRLYKNVTSIIQALESKGVILDLKNMRVIGLDDFTTPIFLDLRTIAALGLTPKQTLSIILHEVGHVFSLLEYLTKTTDVTTDLLDTFTEEYFHKGKSGLEAVKIAFSKTGYKVKSNTPEAVIQTLDKFILDTFRLRKDKTNVIRMMERASDDFVVRLGYGDELSEAMLKIVTKGRHKDTGDVGLARRIAMTFIGTLISSLIIILSLLIGIIGLTFLAIYVIVSLVFKIIAKLIGLVFEIFFSSAPNSKTHDDILYRIELIKQSLIKEFRRTKDPMVREKLLLAIQRVKKDLKYLKELTGTLLMNGQNFLNSDNYNNDLLKTKMIKELENNELHYYSGILKTNKQKKG